MKTRWIRLTVPSLVAVTMAAILFAQSETKEPSGKAMLQAAQKFRSTLSREQLARASFGFDDAERLNWHFIPRERKGLPLRELEGESLKVAQALIASGLSQAGYEQALSIMSLEEVLYLLEAGDRTERRERRNPGKYYISIFGTPSETGKWGWRVEGHHISLNYTLDRGDVVSSTPEFFGANPAFIDAGPDRVIRPLGTEEDLARQILKLCTPDLLKTAYIDKTAPGDLRVGSDAQHPNPQPETTPAVGLAASQMTADQKKLLAELLGEYLKNMPADISGRRRAALMQAGIDKIHFAWWGETERNQPHYYRIQGPTFLVEYNNTQNKANHVHSYWRDFAGDFGIPLKK